MTPNFRLIVDGNNITPEVSNRLISLSLTDERSDKADQLTLVLDDSDGKLSIPPRKATIQVWLGHDDDLVYKGEFTVDDVQHSGTPDTLTISACSGDFNTSLKQKREHSWHQVVLGDILNTLGKRYNLQPIINADLAAIAVEHIDQANESDINFLTRLGKLHDAVATIKAGRLLFAPAGTGETAGGTAIPPVKLTRRDGDQHSYRDSGRDSDYSGVQANWNNTATAQPTPVLVGTDGNVKLLRHPYATEAEAITAAKSEWRTLQRLGASFNLTLATGNPRLYPETPIIATGWKPEIDSAPWLLGRVVHSVGGGGYTCQLEMEIQGDD